jgi:alpha-mannosidase
MNGSAAGDSSSRLNPAGDFGEQLIEFAVPAWEGESAATLQVGSRSFTTRLTAEKKWTIRIVAEEHLDVGFTDYSEKVAELQSQTIDGVLDTLAQHPDFRWSLDGSWVAEQYLNGRSHEMQVRFLDQVRAGNIVIPPQYSNQHTGVASLEGLIRSLYPSHALAGKYSVPLGAANITDVPSYSWSYASVLHDAGIKYFAAASNSWRAPVLLQGRWNEKSPFYWEGPDGGRVFMWYSRAYLQLATLFGAPPTVEAVHDALPVFLQAYTRPDYLAHSVILFGSQLENTPFSREQASLPSTWNAAYAYPRLEFSTFKDAMESIEGEFGGKAPVVRGDFGPYWEDGYTQRTAFTPRFTGKISNAFSARKRWARFAPHSSPNCALIAPCCKMHGKIFFFSTSTPGLTRAPQLSRRAARGRGPTAAEAR